MDVALYLLKFCGMFDFTARQKYSLLHSNKFHLHQIDKDTDEFSWRYIRDQYYPGFRRFVSNESSNIDDFGILTKNNGIGGKKYQKQLKGIHRENDIILFSLKTIEIFLFNESPGIISIEIALDMINPSLNDITSFINELRNYSTRFWDTKDCVEIDMLTLIQDHILNDAVNEKTFNLSEGSRIADYRGSKLKVFQCFEFKSKPAGDFGEILFELGTFSPIGSMEGTKEYATHSKQYFKQIMKDCISVYNNWTALCLFDTFSMVCFDYLSNPSTLKTWKENYYRIYIYNLYYKYYLFSINSEGLHQRSRLKKQREVLNEFIRLYDTPYISYNFLPNLIHERIRDGLEVGNETEKLRSKIDRMTALINEKSTSLTNIILFIVALMAVVPGNMKDLYDDNQFNRSNIVALGIKIVLLLVVWLIYSKIIRKGIRYIKTLKNNLL